MQQRENLLISIADTIKDYRQGEITPITTETVDRWVNQFDHAVQIPLLDELDYVLQKTYISKEKMVAFLTGLVKNSDITRGNPPEYWREANYLKIQSQGNSQNELLEVFDDILLETYGIQISQCGLNERTYVYLDDIIFSGNRVGYDLEKWIINNAPSEAHIDIIMYAMHIGGYWGAKQRLDRSIKESNKKISVAYWRLLDIENRMYYNHNSEVLWPKSLPDDRRLSPYIGENVRFPFSPRNYYGGSAGPYSSEAGRELLEQELLLAGLNILASCESHKEIIKPLGFSPFGVGFGSTIITYRNCPNNCPLAFWWGTQNAFSRNHLNWYPLFPRKTYDQGFTTNGFF